MDTEEKEEKNSEIEEEQERGQKRKRELGEDEYKIRKEIISDIAEREEIEIENIEKIVEQITLFADDTSCDFQQATEFFLENNIASQRNVSQRKKPRIEMGTRHSNPSESDVPILLEELQNKTEEVFRHLKSTKIIDYIKNLKNDDSIYITTTVRLIFFDGNLNHMKSAFQKIRSCLVKH